MERAHLAVVISLPHRQASMSGVQRMAAWGYGVFILASIASRSTEGRFVVLEDDQSGLEHPGCIGSSTVLEERSWPTLRQALDPNPTHEPWSKLLV